MSPKEGRREEGTVYVELRPADLARVWEAAARTGKRRLLLEITAEGERPEDDTGRLTVRVVEGEDWPGWTAEHARQRAALRELIEALSPAPARDDLTPPDLDSLGGGEVQEIAPGVFLLPAPDDQAAETHDPENLN